MVFASLFGKSYKPINQLFMYENFTNYDGCHRIRYRAKIKGMLQCCITALLFLAMCTSAFAQGSKITGVVNDEHGQPLPGVSVKLKGTPNGTTTNVNGQFNINAEPSQTLVFTFLGYVAQEVNVDNQKSITIKLQPNATNMNEVVVVGYGTQRKATVTGSVASVTNSEIVTTKNENVLNMLAGKETGVRITQNT